MINIEKGKILAPYTTFKIGGPAKYFCEVFDEKGFMQAAEFGLKQHCQVFILGGGSNLLVSDKGFEGLVILNRIRGLDVNKNGKVEAGAGENWDHLVKKCVENDLAGMECLSGIPGTVGGAVVQNISAYGQIVSGLIEKVRVVELNDLSVKEMTVDECEYDYKTGSLFKRNQGKYGVLKVLFRLFPSGEPTVSYADVSEHLKRFKIQPTLFEVREAVRRIRANKGHLIDLEYESYMSSGSFFKNPIIDQKYFERIRDDLAKCSENDNWHWKMPNGQVKVAAARLIEAAGFHKGYQEGNVGLSPKHVLVLINLNHGTADEITTLAQKIIQTIMDRYGIVLTQEIQKLGNF
jgi:UDP-N-acetylmuramate dehydrogenase